MAANSGIRRTWIALRARGLPLSLKIDRRVPFVAAAIMALTLAVLVVSISYGEYSISSWEVIQTLTGTLPADHPDAANYYLVVTTFRLPRILTAFLVGMALATSGTIIQGIARNPLASPDTLGITAGAGVVAVAIIVWFDAVSRSVLPWAALGGASVTATTIYVLSRKRGGSTPMRLILIGVAIASALSAMTSFMLVVGDIDNVQQAYIWLAGSVYGSTWEHVRLLGLWMLFLMPLAIFSARQLNMLALGDEIARGLGTNTEAQRVLLLAIGVALAAAAVAAAGTIGFVGLVAPHVTRRLVGPAHEGLLPVTALFGGGLLVLSDLVGRWVIAPSELPIGVITALIGAPYFMYLLYRHWR